MLKPLSACGVSGGLIRLPTANGIRLKPATPNVLLGCGIVRVPGSGSVIQELLNAQKLSLPANTPLGTRVKVTDGFTVSGAGTDLNVFLRATGSQNGKPIYYSPDGLVVCSWNATGYWELVRVNEGDGYTGAFNVAYPWLVPTWDETLNGGSLPLPTLTHPAVQELTAPSTAQGGVFVSGGTQDGIYPLRADGLYAGKKYFPIIGGDQNDEASAAIAWLANQFQGGLATGWGVTDFQSSFPYYSLSDVATPDLAGSDKFVMAVSGVAYSKRGTFNGKSYYNVIGESTSTSLSAIFWSSTTWHITNAVGVDLDTSTSAVATPDLATFLLGTVVSNVAWLNASDDSPASITVTSVTQGELDAGVLVAGAGTSAVNGVCANSTTANSGRLAYPPVGSNFPVHFDTDSWYVGNSDDYQTSNRPAFPWQGIWIGNGGTPPAPTVTRDDVVSEANWSNVLP